MGHRGKPRLTYANVVTTLALFGLIAGGTAIALPGKHRVTADDLHKNAVRAKAIATGAARSAEIKDGAVGSADVADGSLTGADVADQGLSYDDLGSNSVIARTRSTGPTSSGNGGSANPVTVPVSGNTWTQAANEIDVFFGQVTFTQPATCGNNGRLQVQLFVGGEELDEDGYSTNPGARQTKNFLTFRPWLFEPGSATPRSAELKIFDDCSGAGENFTLNDVQVNTVAIR